MAGIFESWQPEYAARGIATFPLRSDDRKRPSVSNYHLMGLRASRQLALKWGDAEGFGCMAGSHNRLTVVDIDARGAEGERLLADVQREIGSSRFVVRTGGGGFHAYYRHNGEGRKIRLDPRRPIDLLGGGQLVLPPSMGSKAPYEIIEGHLDDLTALTPVRTGRKSPLVSDLPPNAHRQGATAEVATVATPELALMNANSGRNNALFDTLCREARSLPPNLEAFIARAHELNQQFGEPMIDRRVINTARSVFGYFEKGELRTGEHGAWFRKGQVDDLVRDPHLFALIGWLKATNGPNAEFWIANGLATVHLDWPIGQLRDARQRAIQQGWLELISPAAKGRNALYRWGPTAKHSWGRNLTLYPQ